MASIRAIAPQLRALEVPEQLRELPGWLLWRFEHFTGEAKPRKVPYWADGTRRHGQQGGPVDRARLTTFVAARDAAARMGYDGVGFAPLSDFGYTFLDFDNCVGADGKLPDDVTRIVGRTYAEYSPSGNGIRAALKGDLGNHKSASTPDRYGFETFASSGFVTFTGNILPGCEVLGYEDHIAPVDDFTRELCEARFGASTSTAFDANDFMAGREPTLGLTVDAMEELLDALDADMGREDWIKVGMGLHHECDGDDTGFYLWNDWSENGGKYPGEEALRQQWDSFTRRAGVGRKQVTMASVIRMVKQASVSSQIASPERLEAIANEAAAEATGDAMRTPEGFEGKFTISTAETLASRPPANWWIKGILPQDRDPVILFGASGSGKSFCAIDMAASISLGAPWRGRRVAQGRVLLVAAEGGSGVGKRFRAYCQHHGIPLPALNIGVVTVPPNFMERDDIEELVRAVAAAGGADVIIVDTFAQVTPGANENAAEDMGLALANSKALSAATDATVVLVHHAGKDLGRGSRGWSGIKGAAAAQIEVIRHDDGRREIHLEKMKDGEDGLRFGFTLETLVVGLDADGDDVTSCVVLEAETPKVVEEAKTGKGVKRRGKIETHILEMMTLFGSVDTVSLQDLVSRAADALPAPDAGARDTRRQHVRRAIYNLSKEKDGPLKVDGNIVVFFE